MIQATTLLSRLDNPRQIGPDRWQARCPAHEDRTPSLSIRITDEHVLLFCHAGCEVSAILAALSLQWRDICPEPAIPYQQALAAGHRRLRQRLSDISARDWARTLLTIAADDIEHGREHSLHDRAAIEIAREVLRNGR